MTEDFDQRFDAELMARARDLATDIEPPRDLWPEVEAELEQPAIADLPIWQRYLAQAAVLVLLVGASSGLTYLAVNEESQVTPPSAVTSPMSLNLQTASFGDRYVLGPGFQDAHRDLENRLQIELERLSPVARAEVQANMETIRAAISEINVALADEPDNVLLQQLLLNSYHEELALVRTVSNINNSVMLRDDF